jgi:hypothetical protein
MSPLGLVQPAIPDTKRLAFCAVNGYWQAGLAERHIGSSNWTACTILLNAMSSWPRAVMEEFWPCVVWREIIILLFGYTGKDGMQAKWKFYSLLRVYFWPVAGSYRKRTWCVQPHNDTLVTTVSLMTTNSHLSFDNINSVGYLLPKIL